MEAFDFEILLTPPLSKFNTTEVGKLVMGNFKQQ